MFDRFKYVGPRPNFHPFHLFRYPIIPFIFLADLMCSSVFWLCFQGWQREDMHVWHFWHLWHLWRVTMSFVLRYWSLCISHRPAGPIPFEICQPVHHAWELQQILYLVLLVSFRVLWSLSNCHVQHVTSSIEFRSLLEQAADAHNVVFSNATSTGPGRRSELGWSARHVASLRPTDLDRLSCSLMVSAALI